MTDPASPTHTLTIPSLQADIDLPCRIYYLPRAHVHALPTLSCAIVAHPYAPMGGSYDDTIVLSLVDELTQQGYIVGTFNFRGGPGSKAGTSWTAKAEINDYISVIHLLIHYTNDLHALLRSSSPSSEGTKASTSSSSPTAALSLLLSGYSYGAMVTTLLPPLSSCFQTPSPSSTSSSLVAEIRAQALRLAHQTTASPSSSTRHHAATTSPLPEIRASYLLISPLLGPIANLATFFAASSARIQGEGKLVEKGADTLVVYGDRDTFTSAQRVRDWCGAMGKKREQNGFEEAGDAARGFTWREIEGAGHFWREGQAEAEMRRVVRDWIQKGFTLRGLAGR